MCYKLLMERKETLGLIEELSNAPGVSGFEDEVIKILRSHGDGLGEWKEDAIRNLYLHRAANDEKKPVLMLDAHSDEVGFLIRAIRPNGTLDFIPLGGWVASNVAAHRVLVRSSKGEWVPGIIASKPPHFLSEADKNKAPDLGSMVIDIGAGSEREVREDYNISIAAPVVPDVSFEYQDQRDIMIGKAFDCRLGCAAIIETFKLLSGKNLGVNIIGSFSAQEEMGLRGATVAAQTIKPDIAICFEGSPADDTVVEAYSIQTAIKKGPMLRHIDARMITNPRFQSFALNTARENSIPHQEGIRTGGSTNAGIIHVTGKAVPAIVIGIPSRYIHTHYSMASFSDFENSVKLALEIILKLNEDVIKSF